MKKIILTIDYELFFGEKNGSVDSCMIKPTELLSTLLAKYDSRMTVFWDILHFWKLKKLADSHSVLAEEATKIEEQIQKLAEAHHDVQLHLHPHWINTTFDGQDWQFNLDGYKLQSLSLENNPNDINSIAGCVKIGKDLIESTVRKVKPDHKVNTFRAGGYCIQPFDKLSKVFLSNEIFIDSSSCYGFKLCKAEQSYDFTVIPRKNGYRFDEDIVHEEPEGSFIEFPIGSIKVSPIYIFWWAFLRRYKYKNLRYFKEIISTERFAKKASSETSTISKGIRKGVQIFLKDNYVMLTPDNFFKEKLDYLVKHADEESVMILHPKYLNYNTLELLECHLKEGNIRFISLYDKIKQTI